MSLVSPSVARPLSGVALALLLHPGRALAASVGDDDPPIDPRIAMDPRSELDFRLDRDDEPRGRPRPSAEIERPRSPVRTPLWFSLGATYRQLPAGEPAFGAMLVLGLPLDRIAAPPLHIGAGPSGAAPPPLPARSARSRLEAPPPSPPPPPPSPAAPPSPARAAPDAPLRMPVVVTPAAARAAVDAALRHAKLTDPEARIDAMATRIRRSAGLPELRLRVMRTVDDGQTLSPTSYDPARVVAVDAIRFWLEARATWRLDRLLFAEEEVALERMRHERAEAQTRVTREVLKLLFDWQRARASADNPDLPPEENLAARLRAVETEAELDLMTEGWFGRWRASVERAGRGAAEGPRAAGPTG